MWCSNCEIYLPYLGETAKCATCGKALSLTSEDILGDSPVRIVTEVRVPQVQLARKVEDAIHASRCLVAEAGTGTGKSFAVLVPAILSGKRVVVSTATTLLQHQYMTQALPFLAAAMGDLGYEVSFGVAKGKTHYLCRRQFERDKKKLPKFKGVTQGKWEDFVAWVESSEWEDKQELGNDVPPFWSLISAEECIGAQICKLAKNCGYVKRKMQLQNANIIVANHAIVGMNIRIGGDKILPTHQIYVIDEAHKAEDYFRNAFSSELGENSVQRLVRYLERGDIYPPSDTHDGYLKDLEECSKKLFARGASLIPGGDKLVIEPEALDPELTDLLGAVQVVRREVIGVFTSAKNAAEIGEEGASELMYMAKVVVNRVDSLREKLADIVQKSEASVLYVEDTHGRRARYKIRRCPVFIGDHLAAAMYPSLDVTVLTSATLAVGNNFSHFRTAMGVPTETDEFQALSPFDYGRRSVLYLPNHLPVHPNNDKMCLDKEAALVEYFEGLTKEIVRLVKISKGHAFILCSARTEMQELFERTRGIISYPTRIQESGMSTGALEEWFRNEENPVLFATKSFWEGVSIEGAQLRMVIIPKVPFPVPSDPVFKAKETALKKTGASGFEIFKKLSVPAMVMDVQQGLGRLIRTMDDFGVAAILDNRVTPGSKNFKRGYANTLLQTLPFTVQVRSLDLVRQAMEMFIGK